MALNFDAITIDTLMVLEDHGVTLDELAALEALDTSTGKMPPTRVLAAMAFIVARSNNPAATWEDARGYSFADLLGVLTDAAPDADPED